MAHLPGPSRFLSLDLSPHPRIYLQPLADMATVERKGETETDNLGRNLQISKEENKQLERVMISLLLLMFKPIPNYPQIISRQMT